MENKLNSGIVSPLSIGEATLSNISPTKTRVVLSPLEKGFGMTLGNSMRRILLSSLPGCKIISIKIEGISHEYGSIPGIKEDMVEIVLNLKKVVAKPISNMAKETVKIDVKGPTVLTAKSFISDNIEIVNPDQVICTVSKEISIPVEVTFSNGRGFRSAKDSDAIGTMSEDNIGGVDIDAVFSPIKLVSIEVEETRVGQKIGYDKLVMEIETNASINVKNALDFAAKTLKNQINALVFFDDELDADKEDKKEKISFDPILLRRVETLDLSVRSNNCMRNIGVVYIGDLVTQSESEILKTANFGRKSLNEIKSNLREVNLSLNMVVPGWPPKGNIDEIATEYVKNQSNF